MTAAEMVNEFGIRYAMEINDSVPGWEDDEIYSFLNKAQRKTVEDLYLRRNFDLLKELLWRVIITGLFDYGALAEATNGYYFNMSSSIPGGYPYLYYVQSWSRVTRTNPTMTSTLVKNQSISLDNVDKFAVTEANKPFFLKPAAFFDRTGTDEIFVVLYDYYTTNLDRLYFEYIREPNDIASGVDCELNSSLHDSIVDLAVTYAIETLESPRVNTQPAVNQDNAEAVDANILGKETR